MIQKLITINNLVINQFKIETNPMSEGVYKYIWRCANCSCHFANITRTDGLLKQEKKCPKCKALNKLTLTNKEIFIHCRLFDPNANGYGDERVENYLYPEIAG